MWWADPATSRVPLFLFSVFAIMQADALVGNLRMNHGHWGFHTVSYFVGTVLMPVMAVASFRSFRRGRRTAAGQVDEQADEPGDVADGVREVGGGQG